MAGFELQLHNSIESQQLFVDTTRENSGRHCMVYGTFQTTGWGCAVFDTDVTFGVSFTETPIVSYAAAVPIDQQGQTFGDYTNFPRVSGGVYRWRTTPKGLYTGAVCFACVELAAIADYTLLIPPALPAGFIMDHHFTFAGIAVKVVPAPDFAGG